MATKKTIGELVYKITGDDSDYNKVINRTDQSTEKLTQTMGRNKGALDSTITSLAGAYLGYQGLTKAIDATIGSAISYESAFAGVRKTVNGTEEQLQTLSDEFIGLSKTMPVTAEEFAKIGELAGQLGVPIENIADFAKTIAMVGTATNLTTEQASTDFARFANILQLPLENVDRLGATIVGLGNNLATTESEIDAMALRIAGAGATLGLTAPQVLGWAGALSSVGIEAEAGGSSISRLMIEISAVASEGGKALDKFAKVAGVSADDFKKKYQTDANGALKDFFAGLQRIQEGGGDLIGVLNNLGITEVRQRDAVLRLVGAGDILTKSLDLANDSWTENTALQTEAEKRYKTTSSQLTILKNNWADLGRQLGTVILPIVNTVIEFFRQMSQVVVLSVSAIKTAILAMGTTVVSRLQAVLKGLEGFINGAIDLANGALKAFGKDEAINHVTLSVKALDSAVESMKNKTKEAGAETAKAFWAVGEGAFDATANAKKLSDAQTLLGKGSGEASDEIKALTDSLKDNSKANKEAEEEAKKLAENWTKLKDQTVDLKDKGTEAIRDLANSNVKDLEKIEEKISDLRKQLADLNKEYNADISSEESSIAEKIVAEKLAIEELNKKLVKARQEKTPDYTAINDLQAEISKRQLALNETIPLQAELQPAVDEATRRSGLTDLQKAVEDYQAKRAQITLEFEDKKKDLEAKLALEEQNKADTIALYEDKQNQINGIIELGNQRFKDLADNRVKITEDEVKKQIYWYNQLADAIARSKQATRTSELPQYSVGGYVPNGGQVHAGEYVIPAHMVAKYGGLISSLEGIRTGATNNNTINNNVTLNNSINEQIDMEAVLKNLSFELNK